MQVKLTQEQQHVIDALENTDRLVVQAFAGTGKTTTLEAIARAYADWHILYLAFNRSVAEKARRRFPRNVDVFTTHGLAYQAVRNELTLSELRGDYRPLELQHLFKEMSFREAFAVAATFKAWCESDIEELSEHNLREILRSNPLVERRLRATLGPLGSWPFSEAHLVERVLLLYELMRKGLITPTHSFYLKYCQLNRDRLLPRYDLVLLDEAQDTNRVTLSLIEALGSRLVAVGDEHQQIYGFRGSLNAMHELKGALRLPLTQSWRLNESVTKLSNSLLGKFKGESLKIRAGHNISSQCKSLAFLSRTNAGLLFQVDVMLQAGFTDVRFLRNVKELFELPLALMALRSFWKGKKESEKHIPERFRWLLSLTDPQSFEEYIAETHDTELEGAWKVVRVMGKRVLELKKALYELPPPSSRAFILSTVHTAKGLEWDRVVVLDDFPDLVELLSESGFSKLNMLHRILSDPALARSFAHLVEEINLIYVAFTRARIRLECRSVNEFYVRQSVRSIDKMIEMYRKNHLSL